MKKGFIPSAIQSIKLMHNHNSMMLYTQSMYSLLHGLSWALQPIFMTSFFNEVQVFANGSKQYGKILFALCGMIISYAFSQLMNGVDNCHGGLLNENFKKTSSAAIFETISKMNLIDYENKEKMEDIDKAINGAENVAWTGMALIDTVFFYGTYFLVTGGFMFSLYPILSIAIIIIFIPCICAHLLQEKNFGNIEEHIAPLRREYEYYLKCIKDLKETRLLGITEQFQVKFFKTQIKIDRLVMKAHIVKAFVNFGMDTITTIAYAILLLMLFYLTMQQKITLGAFVAIVASINRIYGFMDEIINERLGVTYEGLPMVKNYYSFTKNGKKEKELVVRKEKEDIIFDDVSFQYPGTNKEALSGITFRIHTGETIAIVGQNGSGKTTLCKLLLGLYCPTKGKICYGEDSIDNLNNEGISALFQNYCKYKATVYDNIVISDIERHEIDEEVINPIAGRDIENLKNGLETRLGREFDGDELSGGQWQRIAIVRALHRRNDYIVLDEPTAAIDPIEEDRLYNDFQVICENKTAVIVTHRIGSAQIADRIFVLKDGQLVQVGSHKELIATEGEYKELYKAQSQWYDDKEANDDYE